MAFPFLYQILEKKEDMKSDYAILCKYLPDFKQFSYLKFCQARLLISSRIFGISINDNKTDVLAPFADLLNHKRPRQTQWYYDDKLESFVIQATEDIQEGSEIFANGGIFGFFTVASAYAFMTFNLFSAPCFGALGAMKRELGGTKRMLKAVLFQLCLLLNPHL